MKKNERDFTIVSMYVDEIIIVENNNQLIDELKKVRKKEFKIIDLKNLKYFLGVKVIRLKKRIHIYSRKYTFNEWH